MAAILILPFFTTLSQEKWGHFAYLPKFSFMPHRPQQLIVIKERDHNSVSRHISVTLEHDPGVLEHFPKFQDVLPKFYYYLKIVRHPWIPTLTPLGVLI